MSTALEVGFRAVVARSSPLAITEVDQVFDVAERWFGQSAAYRVFAVATGRSRDVGSRARALEAIESGESQHVTARPSEPDWRAYSSVSIFTQRGHPSGTAPSVNWSWFVDSPVDDGPRMPDGVDLDRWLDRLGELAGLLGAEQGHVTGARAEDSRGHYGVHAGAYYWEALDVLAGYLWINLIDDSMMSRLLAVRSLNDFPFAEVRSFESATGGRVHLLRASRKPREMTPQAWSRLRWFYEPLLPEPRSEAFSLIGWAPIAPEDIGPNTHDLRR